MTRDVPTNHQLIGADGAAAHPWFGHHRPAPSRLPAWRIVELIRAEMTNLGVVLDSRLPLEPFVIARSSYEELFNAADALLRLLRRTALSLGPDPVSRVTALRADPAEYPLFGPDDSAETEYCAAMCRPDVLIGPDGLRFLEFNVSGAFGGPVELRQFHRVWDQAFTGPNGRPRYGGADPFLARALFFEHVCARRGLPRKLAGVGTPDDLSVHADHRYFTTEIDYLRGRGFDATFLEPARLLDGLGLPGPLRYPLGLRYFAVGDWRRRGVDVEPVRVAQDNGFLLLPPQSSALLANKKVLALVSEGQPWMTAADRGLVDRYVPWTRIVRDGPVRWHGAEHDLATVLSTQRERLVLKKAVGMMGLEVLLGPHTEPERWESAVHAALVAEDSIVQEYVPPASYQLLMTDPTGAGAERVPVTPVLSPCLFSGRSGGCWVRFFPPERSGVISVYGYAANENVALVPR